MGRVYAATVREATAGLDPGDVVALKVIHPHLLETEGFFRRFLREAEIGALIRHENVVHTYHCDQVLQDGVPQCYLVMEYVEGQTLRELLAEMGQVPEELCRHVAQEICRGLTAIHEAGAVHRDLKPDNVLFTPEHNVKVMDLGVARLVDEQIRLSQTGAFVGSVEYAAPEQFKGGGLDARTDLHALGILLYEIATGHQPFRGDDLHTVIHRVCEETPRRIGELHPQLSPFFEEVVHTLLRKDREGRFASAAQLLELLDAGEEGTWWRDHALALREETGRPLRRVRVPRATAVYGREGELSQLREHFAAAARGDGRVVLLEGEAGIGKSRLVDELVMRLRRDGEDPHFLFGSYPPGGAAAASGALSTAFREHFGGRSSVDYLRETPSLAPAFDAVLRGDSPPEGSHTLSAEALGSCFVHAARALAEERTTVLLVDDLHFAPDEARALFATLAQAVPGHRILMIGSSRPREGATWQGELLRLEHVTHLALERLGAKDLAGLLEDSFGSPLLADRLGMQIARKSDGNPFFVFEIIRGLREGNFIARKEDGTWAQTGVIDAIQIPSSVLELVAERVSELDEDDRNLLDVSACWGYEFDPLVVGDVLGLARIPLLRRLGQIERRHRLVRALGRRYVFDHHQVQEALYESLSELLREEYHAALAEVHEARLGGNAAGAGAVELCDHYLRGGRGDDARRFLAAALEHLSGACLHADTVQLIERALAVPGLFTGMDRARLILRLREPLTSLGRNSRMVDLAPEAREAAGDDASVLLDIEVELGRGLGAAARSAEAADVFRSAISSAIAIGSREREAAARTGLGSALHVLGRIDEAREEHVRSLRIARDVGDDAAVVRALVAIGHTWSFQGHPREARPFQEEAAELARARGLRNLEGGAEMGLGLALRGAGLLEEARAAYQRALAAYRETGDRGAERAISNNLGATYLAASEYDAAEPHFARSLALCIELGDLSGESVVLGNVGAIHMQRGRLDDAAGCCERQLALCRELHKPAGEAFAHGNLGQVEMFRGRLGAARAHAEDAYALAEQTGDRAGQANQLHLLATIAIQRACLEDALSLVERQISLLREIGNRRSEGWALRTLHAALQATGDVVGAREAAEQSIAIAREYGAHELVAGALIDRGMLRATAGDVDGARSDLEEAREIADSSALKASRLLSRCGLALIPGGSVEEAARELAAGSLVSMGTQLEAHLLLWRAGADLARLGRAKELAEALLAAAPDKDRERMRMRAPVLSEVLAAAEEHGL